MNSDALSGTWGHFFPHGIEDVHPSDRDAVSETALKGGSYFGECTGTDGPWLVVHVLGARLRVLPERYSPVKGVPAFRAGQSVTVKKHPERAYKVYAVGWHQKNATALYWLEEDGKRNTKRYYTPEELDSAPPPQQI